VSVQEDAARVLRSPCQASNPGEMKSTADLVLVLGGDGTFLYAAGLFHGSGIPMLGVNFGAVGFLNEVSYEDCRRILTEVLAGRYRTQKRMLLEATVNGRGERYTALNDLTVSRGTLSRTIGITCLISGRTVGSYKADGIIVATPTGSTAYSLSANGPVIAPDVASILINPICPHTLAVRPLVAGPGETVTVRVRSGDDPVYLTIDGQRCVTLGTDDSVVVKRSPRTVPLVVTPEYNFFDLLSRKLDWKR
jgi:NAD+ kinase